MLDLGLNAAGALTIGLGVLPVVAGLASLWRAPGEPVTRELRTFRSVLLAAIIGFGLYTAVKATYVSITFATYTYERNLIYLAPLLFTGTALWLERRRLQSNRARSIGGLRPRPHPDHAVRDRPGPLVQRAGASRSSSRRTAISSSTRPPRRSASSRCSASRSRFCSRLASSAAASSGSCSRLPRQWSPGI